MSEVSSSGYVYTDEEMKVYNQERTSIYRGTIAVCIIYASIAFFIILLGYFTEWGREFLLGTILPFVITYIIGTIVIIIILADWVAKYKPHKIDDRIGYDNDICPDYWHLAEINPELDSTIYSSNVNDNLMKYKCVMDPNILNKIDINDADTDKDDKYHFTNSIDMNSFNVEKPNTSHLYVDLNSSDIGNDLFGNDAQTKFPEFKKHAAYMINYEQSDGTDKYKSLEQDNNKRIELYDPNSPDKTNPTPYETIGEDGKPMPLVCDTVYPLYLSAIDTQNAEINRNDNKNVFRCAYAKACGIPWTEAGCK